MSSNVRAADPRTPLTLHAQRFVWGERTFVMGILNVTPDSFSGDGRPLSDDAVAHGLALLEAGADILDIGGESTRPGHTPVDALEESRRVVPVIAQLRALAPHAILSIDTFKPAVFAAAHDAGADILNSIWALDGELATLAAARGVAVVIMHNTRVAAYERDVVEDVLRYLEAQARRAFAAGIAPGAVIVDPGIGFGKSPEHNLSLLAALDRVVALGFPTLLGTSRKSTIGKLTGREPADRAFGTAATVALAIAAKIDIVRVHDVAQMCDVVRVADAIVRGRRPPGFTDDR